MITAISTFIFLWFTMCALWHEMMHALEGARQGIKECCIVPKFKPIPGISYKYWGKVKNRAQIDYAGGFYTSILCFFLMFISSGHWRDSFWILAWVQLFYGIYEMKYLSKWNTSKSFDKYDKGRYLLYVVVVLVCIGLLHVR